MTNDVVISMQGMQFGINKETDSNENIEIITVGKYYKKSNSSYLIYDEIMDGIEQPISNMVKYYGGCIEVTKKGAVNVHMVFEEGKQNMTSYHTPYGNLVIGIDTKRVLISETEDRIHIQADYALDINYEFLADCQISMDISPKENLHLA